MSKLRITVVIILCMAMVVALCYVIPEGVTKYKNKVENNKIYHNCMIDTATDYCISINLSNATYYGNGLDIYKYFLCKDENKRIYLADQKYMLTSEEVDYCDALVGVNEHE